MNKFVLFIRDHGSADVLDFHPDQASAQRALEAYVSEKTGQPVPSDPDAAEQVIARYFDRDKSFFAIAGVPAGSY
ncbi:hypothetical protein QLH51_12515 [Sphingomonas sp. 2R-10]|uniref:hypothetical protein n=1 Tax=Sphingomonas sp. 2R-10 TaxID=3045148 RepID=UPI0024BB097A|nr:hypothetical protein [Sphingomonas sp. 2R-10]MDJ0277619.1 hypothetical protein [Sphingomonas sp. 2R-10]